MQDIFNAVDGGYAYLDFMLILSKRKKTSYLPNHTMEHAVISERLAPALWFAICHFCHWCVCVCVCVCEWVNERKTVEHFIH